MSKGDIPTFQLRRNSNKLIKSASHASSHGLAPITSDFRKNPKNVHFTDGPDRIVRFREEDAPLSIRAGSPAQEAYSDWDGQYFPGQYGHALYCPAWQIEKVNFTKPSRSESMRVRLKHITLSVDQQMIVGIVSVINIAFQKTVVVRFTLDSWETVSDTAAEYCGPAQEQYDGVGFDHFRFTIELPDRGYPHVRTLILCVQYKVNGQEYWDNNAGENYVIRLFSQATERNYEVGEEISAGFSRPNYRIGHSKTLQTQSSIPFRTSRTAGPLFARYNLETCLVMAALAPRDLSTYSNERKVLYI